MHEQDWLAERFEAHRTHLRAVAYRMLGSLTEADDAVQDTWLRLDRADVSGVDNLGGWLTTVVARVCLDRLRGRREQPVGVHLPEPVISRPDGVEPEQAALLAEGVGLALLVVLDTLAPAERLAFVLHDMFAVPFDDIARIVDRSPEAARQLASRARRRVRGAPTASDADLETQRAILDAFFAAAHEGDFDALVALLDPDVVLHADIGPGGAAREVRGAETVARRALTFSRMGLDFQPALVNGAAGAVSWRDGEVFSIGAMTVRNGRIVELDFFADPERIRRLDLSALEG
jgi:RNA polymerase sigma factor (sigma-70 family)